MRWVRGRLGWCWRARPGSARPPCGPRVRRWPPGAGLRCCRAGRPSRRRGCRSRRWVICWAGCWGRRWLGCRRRSGGGAEGGGGRRGRGGGGRGGGGVCVVLLGVPGRGAGAGGVVGAVEDLRGRVGRGGGGGELGVRGLAGEGAGLLASAGIEGRGEAAPAAGMDLP